MAINRGPWNALVDDDGSNLVGSIWNKAAIKTVVLDPVDAELAKTEALATWPLNPADFTANVGAWAVTSAQIAFALASNAILDLFVYVNASTLSAAPSSLFMKIPASRVAAAGATPIGPAVASHTGASFEVGFCLAPGGGTVIELHRPALGAYGAGAATVYFTLRIPLVP